LTCLLWPAASAAGPLQVFACEPEWGALTRALGGEAVSVYDATTALQDVHKIQPRPSLIAKFRQAKLAVCTGAELEIGWLPVLQQTAGNPALQAGKPGMFEAYRYVEMLEVPATLDRAQGDVHPYGNPHIHTNPRNIAKVAAALANRLAQIDPARAERYHSRHRAFSQRWTEAIATWETKAEPLKNLRVISHHKYWGYLYHWLDMQELATLEPKPAVPPSAAHLAELLQRQRAQPAKLVIYSSYDNARPSEWLAERARIPRVKLPASVGGVAGADDLFKYFDVVLDRLLQAANTG
ncbi:MAG: metal ABC transporter substrate-binding protein, partial [Nevskiales bacterium]